MLCFLYVCMVNTLYLFNFVETPRKFIIAKLSIRKLGSSSVLIIRPQIARKAAAHAVIIICICIIGKYVISREYLANESLRNCDVRQVLCILTIFCRFKPKNVCILPKFSSFQSFQSKIILVKCCKEVIVPPE